MALLEILAPPYSASQDVPGDGAAPLSAVFVYRPDGKGGLSRLDWSPVRRSPWCPVAVADGLDLSLASAIAFRNLPNDIVPFNPARGSGAPLETIRARQGPDPVGFCRYLDAREVDRELGEAVLECLEASPDKSPSRSLHRKLARLGGSRALHVSDWRHLWRLTTLAPRPSHPVAILADRYGAEERTLRAHLDRLIGMSPTEFRGLVGWEWIVEAALRRHGYIHEPPSRRAAEPPSRRAAEPPSRRAAEPPSRH